MSLDWIHQFCLACDKQTDGSTYCSESCRLAEFEKNSCTSSPEATSPSQEWSWTTQQLSITTPSSKFYLSPAYDFSSRIPIGSSLTELSRSRVQARLAPGRLPLSPSSSHSSLNSIQTASSVRNDGSNLSEIARRELRAYASSFESVRLQRRRSC
jgi:hypothetical protein